MIPDDELARMRRDAEALATLRDRLNSNMHPDWEREPWRVQPPDDGFSHWTATNDQSNLDFQYDVFEEISEHGVRFLVAARNTTPEADVLALLDVLAAERARADAAEARVAWLETLSRPLADFAGQRPLVHVEEGRRRGEEDRP